MNLLQDVPFSKGDRMSLRSESVSDIPCLQLPGSQAARIVPDLSAIRIRHGLDIPNPGHAPKPLRPAPFLAEAPSFLQIPEDCN